MSLVSDRSWAPRDRAQVSELGVDMLTIVGHKVGAPKGVAALFVKRGLDIPPMIRGGGQEMGRRAGSENVVLIAGMGKAAEVRRWPHSSHFLPFPVEGPRGRWSPTVGEASIKPPMPRGCARPCLSQSRDDCPHRKDLRRILGCSARDSPRGGLQLPLPPASEVPCLEPAGGS